MSISSAYNIETPKSVKKKSQEQLLEDSTSDLVDSVAITTTGNNSNLVTDALTHKGTSRHLTKSICTNNNNSNSLQSSKNNKKQLTGDKNNNPSSKKSSSPINDSNTTGSTTCSSTSSSTSSKSCNNGKLAPPTLPLGAPVEMDASMKEKIAKYETFFRTKFGSKKIVNGISNVSIDAFNAEVTGTFRYSSHSPARVVEKTSKCKNISQQAQLQSQQQHQHPPNQPKQLTKSFSKLKKDQLKFSSGKPASLAQINQGLLEQIIQQQQQQQLQQKQPLLMSNPLEKSPQNQVNSLFSPVMVTSPSPRSTSPSGTGTGGVGGGDVYNTATSPIKSPPSGTNEPANYKNINFTSGISSHQMKHSRSASNPLIKPAIAPKPRLTTTTGSTNVIKSDHSVTSAYISDSSMETTTSSTTTNYSGILKGSPNELTNEAKTKDDCGVEFTTPFKARQFRYLSLRKYSTPILKSFQSKSHCNCSSSSPSRCKCEPVKSISSTTSSTSSLTSSSSAYLSSFKKQASNSSKCKSGKSKENDGKSSNTRRRLSSPNSPPESLISELKNRLQTSPFSVDISSIEQQQQQIQCKQGYSMTRLTTSTSLSPSSLTSAAILKKKVIRKRSKSLDPAGAAAAMAATVCTSEGGVNNTCFANCNVSSMTTSVEVTHDSSIDFIVSRESDSPSESDSDTDYSTGDESVKNNVQSPTRHTRVSRFDSHRRSKKTRSTASSNTTVVTVADETTLDNSTSSKREVIDRRLSCFSSSSSSTCSSFKSTPPASPCLSGTERHGRLIHGHQTNLVGTLTATSSSSTLTSSNTAINKDGEIVEGESTSLITDMTNTLTEDTSTQLTGNSSDLTPEKKKLQKLRFIAKELTETEAEFVDKMNLLAVELKEIAEKHLPKEQIAELFKYLDVLKNVSSYLLQELRKALETYDTDGKIAHVLVMIGPFLSCYSCFMVEFDKLKSLFDDCLKRYPSFAAEVKEFESSPRCKKLAVSHYFLKPVQRIPQYRLLLEDYLKNLPEGHIDYDDSVKALAIVSTVAEHANQVIKEGDSFMKLLAIQNSLFPHKEIIKPGRVYLKEGDLMKVSRKELQLRRVVLCSDCLFYLTLLQSGLYHLNHEIPLTGMRVSMRNEEHTAYNNELTIISPYRSFMLQAKSTSERDAWYAAITKAIDEHNYRRRTFQQNRSDSYINATIGESSYDGYINTASNNSSGANDNNDSSKSNNCNLNHRASESTAPILGDDAPIWIPDDRVTMCQLCTREFSAFFRRHHCRACGKVVCRQCSANRVPLKYRNFRPSRVCDSCFDLLKKLMEDKKNNLQGTFDFATPTCDISSSSSSGTMRSEASSLSGKSSTLRSTCSNSSNNSGNGLGSISSDLNVDYDKLMSQFTRIPVRLSKRKAKEVPAKLKVNGNDQSSDFRGYLFWRKKNKSKAKRFWFVVKEKVLYRFNASEDVAALESEVLLGWKLELSSEPLDGHPADTVFSLKHDGRPSMTFAAESTEQRDLWVGVISAALVL